MIDRLVGNDPAVLAKPSAGRAVIERLGVGADSNQPAWQHLHARARLKLKRTKCDVPRVQSVLVPNRRRAPRRTMLGHKLVRASMDLSDQVARAVAATADAGSIGGLPETTNAGRINQSSSCSKTRLRASGEPHQ